MEAANKILDKALKLPEEARAFISDKLYQSLHSDVDYEIENAWKEEINIRLKEIASGKTKLISWDEIKKHEQCKKILN